MKVLLCGAGTLSRENLVKLGASIYWILSEEKANLKISLEKFPKKNLMPTKVGT